jgi:hypothetical protein
LEDCERPRRLRSIHGIDYFPPERREWAYQRMLESLKVRATRLNLLTESTKDFQPSPYYSPKPVATYPQVSPKPPVRHPDASTKRKPVWFYGRWMVIILLITGFFGPWIQAARFASPGTEVATGPELYSEFLKSFPNPTAILPLIVGGVFLITLVRLFPWNFFTASPLVRLERMITGIAPAGVLIGMYPVFFTYLYTTPIWLWGFWLSATGIYLAPINILFEMGSSLQKGQRWPWWAWLFAFSLILPWILLLLVWLWIRSIKNS